LFLKVWVILLSLVLLSSFTVVFAEVEITQEVDDDGDGTKYTVTIRETMGVSDSIKLWVTNSTYSETLALLPPESQDVFFTMVGDQSEACLNLIAPYEGERIPEISLENYLGCVDETVDENVLDKAIFAGVQKIIKQNEYAWINNVIIAIVFLGLGYFLSNVPKIIRRIKSQPVNV